MKEKLKWQFEICGINKYHEKGYKGQGVTVLCHEDSAHGREAMRVLKAIAPEVNVLYACVTEKSVGGRLTESSWKISGEKYSFKEVMEKFSPDIISCSLRGVVKSEEREKAIQPYIDDGSLIMVTSAGNEGSAKGVQAMYGNGLVIGAVQFYNNKKADIRNASYSGRTQGVLDVDYVGFMYDWEGTSAATPFVAGQIALFISRFGKVSQSDFQEMIKPYCKDLGENDKDWIYGDGLIVLPDEDVILKDKEDRGGKMMEFLSFNKDSFRDYISNIRVTRSIKRIQLHHTWSPSYKHFTGNNHTALQSNMKNYHVNTNGWSDIAQHFTIFPDGIIMTGRNLNSAPAGIYGANTGAICIECVGNFDVGGDAMTEAQKEAIVAAVKILLDKFELTAEDGVTYHAWWANDGSELGDYIKSKSQKTCPGTNFFGGNTLTAYENNLMPLIKEYGQVKLKSVESINDIVWELSNAGIITDGKLWIKKCEEDINVYWLCRKMANKLRGTL